MNGNSFRRIYVALAGTMLALPCFAQFNLPDRFKFGVGGGFTQPVKHSENRLDTGFNLTAHGGVNIVPHFGLRAEFGYNQLGVTSAVLQSIGVPSGSTRIYSATLNPVIRANPNGRVDPYLTFGGGFYRRTVELTQPSVAVVTGFDPFYGIYYPVGVPAQEVLSSVSQNRGGLNAGGGIEVRLREDGETMFFAEAKYHYIFTNGRTTLIPVTFGFRW